MYFVLTYHSSSPQDQQPPVPFRPKRSDTLNLSPGPDLEPLRQEMNGAPSSGPDVKEGSSVVAKLEEQVLGNGHAK